MAECYPSDWDDFACRFPDITIQANPAGLAPGIYKGAVTLGSFTDATPTQPVDILFQVLASAAASPATLGFAAAACGPKQIRMAGRVLGNNFSVTTGYPNTIEVELQDDCGNPLPDPSIPNSVPATVTASFSSGDPQLSLVYTGTLGARGVYQNSWRPTQSQSSVTVTLRAIAPPLLGLQPGELSISGSVANNPAAPAIFGGGIVGAASYVQNAPLAPGGIISVFGRNLAANQAGASVLPLPKFLARASLNIGGTDVPLFYASDGQINAQLPAELPSGTRLQASVTRLRPDGTPEIRTFPETITLSAASPGIFTVNSDGKGQGAIPGRSCRQRCFARHRQRRRCRVLHRNGGYESRGAVRCGRSLRPARHRDQPRDGHRGRHECTGGVCRVEPGLCRAVSGECQNSIRSTAWFRGGIMCLCSSPATPSFVQPPLSIIGHYKTERWV